MYHTHVSHNYKRSDLHQKGLMQRSPIDRINPPHEDPRRQKWSTRPQPGKHTRCIIPGKRRRRSALTL
jgi:hypothetical protein